MSTMHKLETRIKLDRKFEAPECATMSDITGIVIGYATIEMGDGMEALYLVKLDKGFYSPDNRIWITTMQVHPENLIPID